MAELAVATGDQPLYRSEDTQLGEGGPQNPGADCGSQA